MMNKEEVRQYWRRKDRETFLKVFCLSLIGTAILIVGCGETAEEIDANNAKSRAAVCQTIRSCNLLHGKMTICGCFIVL